MVVPVVTECVPEWRREKEAYAKQSRDVHATTRDRVALSLRVFPSRDYRVDAVGGRS